MSDTTTTPGSTGTTPGDPSRTVNIVVWVLRVLGALLFLWAGGSKVSGDPMQVQGFEAMGLGLAGLYIVGALEIAGAIGLLLPGVAGFAATCLVALMIGATVATIGVGGLSPMVVVPVVTLIVVAVIAWVLRRNAVAFLRFVFGR